jgi:tRNA (mo5U34)-methyltransferase
MLGILYHMKHPLLALERVRSVTRERLIMSTFVDMTWWPKPAMAFYEGSEANRDPTNWWGPNPPAVVGMLRAAGFERVEIVDPPTLLLRRLSARVRARTRTGPPVTTKLSQGAIVCHAWV